MRTFRIAIVGSGPAGFFSALALQNRENDQFNFRIDMFERLPTPFGLVRSGVAPDHPKIKSVSKTFDEIATHPRFSFLGNIEIGRDIALADLKKSYDAVVLATGASQGKSLKIPGEELLNYWSAAEFVSWYNGHPDFATLNVDFSGERAVVIGAGNVALDVARLLTIKVDDLRTTDISNLALKKFRESKLSEICIFARRGPENVSFTAPELRELEKLQGINLAIDDEDKTLDLTSVDTPLDKQTKSKLDFFRSIKHKPRKLGARTLKFFFGYAPKRVEGSARVESVLFTSDREELAIPAQLVVSAIGYEVSQSFGLDRTSQGLVNDKGHISENLFVVGWARRGSTGVIGTNKSDAAEVVDNLVAYLAGSLPKKNFEQSMLEKQSTLIDFQGWKRIDQEELTRGIEEGRNRSKVLSRQEMLEIALRKS
jgi:ferredoxin--NADP+ reductase